MSDTCSSSLFNINDTDSLSGLQSNSQHLLIPDILHRQQSINLTSDPDILPVLLPPCPPAPSSLQQIKPDRKSSYILYSDMMKSEFVAWWLKTDFGKKKVFCWDTKHQADIWNQFHQVASSVTGEPKVLCKKCMKDLDHPQTNQNRSSSMSKHIQGPKCRNSNNRAGRQINITRFLQLAVSTQALSAA
jgi:hypothetical protein